MNKTKKGAIALAVLIVTTLTVPAILGDEPIPTPPVIDNPEYTVTVSTGCDVAINIDNVDFGELLAGDSAELTPTFNLINVGDWNATVEAKFVTNESGVYGMKNGDGIMIPGNNFGLKAVDLGETVYTNLANTDTDTVIPPALPADSIAYNYDAQLMVPVGQASGTYTGMIQLTFSNA